MQATGSNSQPNKQSIRISTDGLSFYAQGERRDIGFAHKDERFLRAMSYCLCAPELAEIAADTQITLCCPMATPLPNDLFDNRQAAEILGMQYPKAKGMVCRTTRTDYGTTVAFAVPEEFDRFLTENYPQADIRHCDAGRIGQVLLESKTGNAPYIRIYTEGDRSCLVAACQGQLQLCNRYDTPEASDTLYFLAEFCDQLHWSQTETRIACDEACAARPLIAERFRHCETFSSTLCE